MRPSRAALFTTIATISTLGAFAAAAFTDHHAPTPTPDRLHTPGRTKPCTDHIDSAAHTLVTIIRATTEPR